MTITCDINVKNRMWKSAPALRFRRVVPIVLCVGILISLAAHFSNIAIAAPPLDSADCGKPSGTFERIICADPQFSELNDSLSLAFKRALDVTSDEIALRSVQDAWLKKIRSIAAGAGKDKTQLQRLQALFIDQINFLNSGCIQSVHQLGANCVCDKYDGSDAVCGKPVKGKSQRIDGMKCRKTIDGYRQAIYMCGPDVKVEYGSGGVCEFGWDIYRRVEGKFVIQRRVVSTASANDCIERTENYVNGSWTTERERVVRK